VGKILERKDQVISLNPLVLVGPEKAGDNCLGDGHWMEFEPLILSKHRTVHHSTHFASWALQLTIYL